MLHENGKHGRHAYGVNLSNRCPFSGNGKDRPRYLLVMAHGICSVHGVSRKVKLQMFDFQSIRNLRLGPVRCRTGLSMDNPGIGGLAISLFPLILKEE